MSLTAIERETVVNFNDAEEMAEVYTHQRRVITALKKNPSAVLLEEGVFQGTQWARFELPKDLISFRSKRRVLGEAERARRAAQLAAARAAADRADTGRRSDQARRSKTEASTAIPASSSSTRIEDFRDEA